MSTDTLTRTACGLYVMPDGDPCGWPNFTWTQEVSDVEGDQEDYDALSLIGHDLMSQVGRDARSGGYVAPTDVAFACLHLGEAPRVEHAGLNHADPDVPADVVDADGLADQWPWTVCGVLEGTWRTVRYRATAGSPLVAYFRAWEWARDQAGGYLLLAAVHPGEPGPVASFEYADPWAKDPASMALKAQKWGL